MYVCICECVRKRESERESEREKERLFICGGEVQGSTGLAVQILKDMFVCVCVREREKERESVCVRQDEKYDAMARGIFGISTQKKKRKCVCA